MRRPKFSVRTMLVVLTIAALIALCARQWMQIRRLEAEFSAQQIAMSKVRDREMAELLRLLHDAQDDAGTRESVINLIHKRTQDRVKAEAELGQQ